MSDALLPLAAEFDGPDESRWRQLAEAALKGAPWERLVGRTEDGIALAPLYRESDVATGADEAGLPGQAPYVRGPVAARDPYLPWDIRAAYRNGDVATTNREILEDLSRGVSSLELLIAGRSGGVRINSADDLSRALDGVILDLAPVAINAGARGIEIGALLADHFSRRQLQPLKPAFNIDLVTSWLLDGALSERFEDALQDSAHFTRDALAQFAGATTLRASGRPAHEAGGGPSHELALMLASGVAHLRALDAIGVDAERAGAAILFTLSVGPDVIVEIAKLRAARALWAQVMHACGASPDHRAMRLQAVTSRRMLTRDDSWTNILRTTAACFAAGAGGADIVTALPFTTPLGEASALSRRLARNTQIILQEESGLGRVADPAGGAWAVEKLTRDMCDAAWALFQGIERDGGLATALRSGGFQAHIAKTRDAQASDYARRKRTITGVTDFPMLDGVKPHLGASSPRDSLPAPSEDKIAPLSWMRWSEPFEALRAKGDAKGNPRIFAANLGPLSEFSPRANFAQNLVGVGGIGLIGADTVYPDHATMIAAFKTSGARVAVLCGADARYATEASDASKALKAAGCDWLILAGKSADETAMRAAGVDQFIFAGQNALEAMGTLHAALGITT